MNIFFRKSIIDELDMVNEMYEAAIIHMESNQIFQWDKFYPDKTILMEDMKKDQLHIGFLDNEIAVAYALNQDCDEQYFNGNWKYPSSPYCVVHRLCVNPKFQNMGIGTITMQHIAEEIQNKGIEVIRLDCFVDNPQACRMYMKLGYQVVGNAHWRKGNFYLMELKA